MKKQDFAVYVTFENFQIRQFRNLKGWEPMR